MMGFCCSKIQNFFADFLYGPPAKVNILGVDGSGKTTALYRLKLPVSETVQTIPTLGMNVEEITSATGTRVTMWDVGVGDKFRQMIHQYCRGAEWLILVVDSSDPGRFKEAQDELKLVLFADTTTQGIPFVVMANKQDLPESVDPSKLIDLLGLRDFSSNKWTIQGTCATTGEGLHESIETLCEMIKSFRKEK